MTPTCLLNPSSHHSNLHALCSKQQGCPLLLTQALYSSISMPLLILLPLSDMPILTDLQLSKPYPLFKTLLRCHFDY